MYRTITDLAYSRSPECPFIVDERSMANLRSCLYKYENERTLLSADAQTGMRKSIAAALGEKKSSMSEGESRAVVYPSSVDAKRSMDGLCGPRQRLETIEETDSESDTITGRDTPSIPLEPPTLSKVIGSRACKKVTGLGRVDDSTGRKL